MLLIRQSNHHQNQMIHSGIFILIIIKRLVYWTVFGFLHLIEIFADLVLYWFPFYYLFKSVFILYLILPQTNGSHYVYEVIRTFLSLNEKNMKEGLKKAEELKEDLKEGLTGLKEA